MDIKDLFDFIRKIPLFSIYPDNELAELADAGGLKSYSTGDIVFEQGQTGDSFFVVYSGKVRIFQKTDEGKEINLGLRTKGDHFGETALITENPRNATARASEDTILIAYDKHAFNHFLFSRPALREHFDKFIRYTSIYRFLKTCTDLSSASTKDLQALTNEFKLEFFQEGEIVFRQEAIADKFYLIERGKLKVVRWEEGKKPRTINFLREGDFFGEKALVDDTTRYADVACLTDCTLFSLDKEAFRALISHSPKIKDVIEDRLHTYTSDSAPIPYQEIIAQELAATRVINISKDAGQQKETPSSTSKNTHKKLSSLYHRHVTFPFIRQHDQMTCGTTCIMMIAKYYGKNFSSSRVRDLAHVDLSGSSLANLASAAEMLGFSSRGLRLDYETLMSAHLPCIVHWQGYHYIVVYKIDNKCVYISDPAIGNRKYTRTYFEENWNGVTLTIEPTDNFIRQSEDQASLKNFLTFVTPYKSILAEIFIASLLLNIFGLATPIFTQNIVDKVLIHQNISMLNLMLAGMMIVLVFRILTSIVRQYLIIHISMKIDLRMLVVFYRHLLALPLGYFKVRKSGDFISRFSENMKIRDFLTNTALAIFLDAILIVVYLCLMTYYNYRLTAIALAFIPLIILTTLVFTPLLKKLNIDSFNARTESSSHLIESIHAIDTIKAMNLETISRWKWEDKFIKSLNIDFRMANNIMYFNSVGDFVATVGSTVVLWYGAYQVMDRLMSVGELMAFMALMGSVMMPVNRLVTVWDSIQQMLVSVDRLNDVFQAETEFSKSPDDDKSIFVKEPKGEIVFENVYFRYGGDDDPYILSNLNFKIHPGQTLAIVGRSGSGKTTLVRLIARLYPATEGKIIIDGRDIRHINLNNLRKTVGYVLQENHIFDATIRENIAIGDPDANMDKIVHAAKMANAHDFICNLGTGYETRVGESGLQLSGGQKQRLAIARVLYHDPKIVILDEATSSLDSESEQAIQKNLSAIIQDKTAIVIAHRFSTVRNADNILVLDKGEIIEQGTHDELMGKRGLYHYLNYQQLNI